jgi:hypothetical protein
MTRGRLELEVVRIANEIADEATAVEARLEAEAEVQMLTAELAGRPVWQYVDPAPVDRLAELRERWRVLSWAINTPPPE